LEYPHLKYIFCTGRGETPTGIDLLRYLPNYHEDTAVARRPKTGSAFISVGSEFDKVPVDRATAAMGMSVEASWVSSRASSLSSSLGLSRQDTVALLAPPGEAAGLFAAASLATIQAGATLLFPCKAPPVDVKATMMALHTTPCSALVATLSAAESLAKGRTEMATDRVKRVAIAAAKGADTAGIKTAIQETVGAKTVVIDEF
jgi:hypothetical protein